MSPEAGSDLQEFAPEVTRFERGLYEVGMSDEKAETREELTFVSVCVKHFLEFFLEKGHMVNDQGMVAPAHQLSRMMRSQSLESAPANRAYVPPCLCYCEGKDRPVVTPLPIWFRPFSGSH